MNRRTPLRWAMVAGVAAIMALMGLNWKGYLSDEIGGHGHSHSDSGMHHDGGKNTEHGGMSSQHSSSHGGQPNTGEGLAAIEEAYQAQKSGVWVEGKASIAKVLPDDTKGDQHQRFIVELPNGQSLLFAHNIDLAPRLEGLKEGSSIAFRGRYEWNEKGGVIHWTHHNPQGGNGGWLEFNGQRSE